MGFVYCRKTNCYYQFQAFFCLVIACYFEYKKRYKNSTLSKEHILRSTYYKLAVNNLSEVNDCYLNTKPGARVWIVQDLISKIIQNGPDLVYSIESIKD